MEKSTGKIGIMEYIAIILLTIGTKLADDLPTILVDSLYNAAWMTPIISGAIAVVPIYLLIKTMMYYDDKGLLEIIVHLFGRYIGFVVIFALWIIASSAIIIDTAIYTEIIGTMYFTRTPTIVIFIILMGVSAYGAKKGLEQIGSVAKALLPCIKISLFLALILTIILGDFNYIFPFFGPGGWEVIKESTLRLSIYGDILYLCLLVPYIRNTNDFKKGTWIALGVLILELSIAIFAYIILFDFESVRMLNYPFHEVIRYVNFGFMENIEMFFFPFWLIAAFVRFAVYLYLNGILFGRLFRIIEFEHIIPSLATLFLLLGMLLVNQNIALTQTRDYLLVIVSPVFFLLPCILWSAAKLKGDYKDDKKK
ncbi:GerAB/ArcD/ProY family transporter [Virgibacillus sp. DJP39]|uniref:GerAB/ArcD/ProY family transporter n=1 Tax=Virgibacillus sp. DJP39 TaxID=3409790 RepID=UPI003BB619CE